MSRKGQNQITNRRLRETHSSLTPNRRFHVPVAFYVMLSASHLLLVVNSSINVVLYCVVGKSFRAELKSLARDPIQ